MYYYQLKYNRKEHGEDIGFILENERLYTKLNFAGFLDCYMVRTPNGLDIEKTIERLSVKWLGFKKAECLNPVVTVVVDFTHERPDDIAFDDDDDFINPNNFCGDYYNPIGECPVCKDIFIRTGIVHKDILQVAECIYNMRYHRSHKAISGGWFCEAERECQNLHIAQAARIIMKERAEQGLSTNWTIEFHAPGTRYVNWDSNTQYYFDVVTQ